MPAILRANAYRAALAIALLGPGSAAEASCRVVTPIAPVLLQQYLNTPATLLYPSPDGNDGLRVTVERFVPSGPDAIKAVLSTVTEASHGQQLAIGAGLAEAARFCVTQDSAIVQRIKNAVRSSGSSVVEQSFMASFEEDAGGDAAAMTSSSAETRRSAANRGGPSTPSLLAAHSNGVGKIPNPFGPLDEWR